MVSMLSWEGMEGAEAKAHTGDLGAEGADSIYMDGGRQKDRDIHHIFISPSEHCHLHYTDR